MALDFPSSPVDGQIYGSYMYSTPKGVWQSREESAVVAITSPTKPLVAKNGDIWINTSTGSTYFYYDDGTSSQWIELIASIPVSVSSKANLAGGNSFTGNQTISGTVNATSFTKENISVIPKFLQVVHAGALGTNYSFTLTEKSLCQFAFSATGYYGSTGIRTWNLIVNSTTISSTKHFFNVTSTHLTSHVGIGTITLPAGTYNAQVTTDAYYDSNDFCTVWATAIPTA